MMSSTINIPDGCSEVLLHACCAPCSSAVVEWLIANEVRPTIFYYNPNIWPREEYEIRKNESKRHAEGLGIRWIDGDYDHEGWRSDVMGLEGEPERGRRCEQCFTLRLMATARKAKELGIQYFATTLASSRWKSLEQIEQAGKTAEKAVNDTKGLAPCAMRRTVGQSHCVKFWAQNWRKGGLQERRNYLLKEYGFYNQQYCGCEFSARGSGALTKPLLREQMREAKRQHEAQLAELSTTICERLERRLESRRTLMVYWPLKDEVDIRPLIDKLVEEGREVLLPKVTGDETMILHRYTSRADLVEGAFHIMEPVGEPFTDYEAIDLALIPGVAFDAAGHRLGRGRGYYDRFLTACPLVYKVGVCFPFQRVAEVPSEAHDVCMDEII